MGERTILKIENLSAGYLGKEVLHNISLEVKEGEIVTCVIGPNGAGKSTLFKAIFGLVPIKDRNTQGKIIFDGEDILASIPRENVRRGIGYLLQGGEVFTNLTVEDNLLISYKGDKRAMKERLNFVYSLFPALRNLRRRRAGLLSGGERKMLAIGLVLMSSPRLLLLDEPTAGLSYNAAKDILKAIANIKKMGISVLLIEQNIEEALAISDRVYLLRDGELVAQGSPEEIIPEIEKLFYEL
jgi:branched-chain amino acid transport system ATP-binding protein